MALSLQQRAFKLDQITYLDRKSILLDRVLLNLFELLRFDGRPPVRMRRQKPVDVQALVEQIKAAPARFIGFDVRPDIPVPCLQNDLSNLINLRNPNPDPS